MSTRSPKRALSSGFVLVTAWCFFALITPSALIAGPSTNRLWASVYNGPTDRADGGTAIGLNRNGTVVFVTGSSEDVSRDSGFVTIAYDGDTGSTRWTTAESTDGLSVPFDLDVGGGRVFVGGVARGHMKTIAYDAGSGAQLWSATHRSRFPGVTALTVDPASTRVFVTGGGSSMRTISYDAASGDERWTRHLGTFGSGSDVVVSPSGRRVFVCGGARHGLVVAYRTSDGHELWRTTFSSFGPMEIGLSPDGRRILLGGQSGQLAKVLTVQAVRASTGEPVWSNRFSVSGGSFLSDLEVGPSGDRVFATASFGTDPSIGILTVAYDADSSERAWMDTIHKPRSVAYARALDSGPNGLRVIVTGRVDGHLETVSYAAASGKRNWVHHSKKVSDGIDIVVGPGGVPFVTGWRSPGRAKDILTIAYAT
jgi:hypothetical protein